VQRPTIPVLDTYAAILEGTSIVTSLPQTRSEVAKDGQNREYIEATV
jgi:hypothetical protein